MQISERWLREWCDPGLDRAALAETLTLAGLEVERVEVLTPLHRGVVLAQVLEVAPHPNADRLRVCRVQAGAGAVVPVVCGAPNVRAGLYAPLATVGSELPGGPRIKAAKLRGEPSEGMLCSAAELGLAEDAGGLLELPPGMVGTPISDLLGLDDAVLHLGLTPNRGDCLAVRGIARELAALTGAPLTPAAQATAPVTLPDPLEVRLEHPADGPRYAGRILRGLDPTAQTPLWLRERLRRAGLRSLGPIVDVTNYVMLELGQPLHAFDLAHLAGPVVEVRRARRGEALTVIGGHRIELEPDALVIADARGPVALAGVIGGADSAVGPTTTQVVLESAWFAPATVGRTARAHDLITDAALRFERGADPAVQVEALERASVLLLEICGGRAGPVTDRCAAEQLPRPDPIVLRPRRAADLLGTELDPGWCAAALGRLGGSVAAAADALRVTPPSWRGDWRIEEDLVEELARLHGYADLPGRTAHIGAAMPRTEETRASARSLADILVARGYQEAITYSFVDAETQALCDPQAQAVPLHNPLSAELSVLRTQVWPGLVRAAAHNLNRQAGRVRLCELGRRFAPAGDGVREERVVAAAAVGSAQPEQWGEAPRPLDFFDLKADLEALGGGAATRWRFQPADHPALHPGQSAWLLDEGRRAGLIGRLHPHVERQLDLPPTYVFEILAEAAAQRVLPQARPVDRYPSVRRDLALVVPEDETAAALQETIETAAGAALRECVLFDVYRGAGLPSGTRSLAFGLRLAHTDRTLTDQEVDAVVARVVDSVTTRHRAFLREQHGGRDQS